MVPGLMGERDSQAGRTDLAVADKPTVQTNMPRTKVKEGLRVGEFDAEVHVIGEFRPSRLESLDQGAGSPPWPACVRWPKESGAHRGVEERHSLRCWQTV
jgi:hypothetical protein